MNKSAPTLQRYFLTVFIFWLIYQVFTFLNPIAEASLRYGLTEIQLRLIQLSVSLPYLATWLIGVWGSFNLRRYSNSLEDKDQKKSFKRTSQGILLLVLSSMTSSVVGSFRSYYSDIEIVTPITTIINNYLYVFPTLICLYLFYSSAKGLAKSVQSKPLHFLQLTTSVLISAGLTTFYLSLILTNPARQTPLSSDISANFYLPDILIFTTIALPLFISWILGILSIFYTIEYRKKTSGAVYQYATSLLTGGKFFIVINSMFIQFLISLGTLRLLDQSWVVILGVIYLFILLQGVGYLLIGFGSQKLTTIENILEKYISK